MSSALRFFLVFACVSAALSIGVSAIAAHGLTLAAQDAQALAWAKLTVPLIPIAPIFWSPTMTG